MSFMFMYTVFITMADQDRQPPTMPSTAAMDSPLVSASTATPVPPTTEGLNTTTAQASSSRLLGGIFRRSQSIFNTPRRTRQRISRRDQRPRNTMEQTSLAEGISPSFSAAFPFSLSMGTSPIFTIADQATPTRVSAGTFIFYFYFIT